MVSLEFDRKRHQKTTKETNRVKTDRIACAYQTRLAEDRDGIIEHQQLPVPVFSETMNCFLESSKTEHRKHPATYRRYKTSSKPLLRFLKFKSKALDAITADDVE